MPSPSAQTEDDGVLLSVVLDIDKGRSFLLVLDAASLKELARAAAPACHPLPFPWQFLREQASLGLTYGPSSPTFRPEFKAAP